jgi:hypothetical protein
MHTSIFHLHKILCFFYSSFLQVFGCLLGARSFDSSKGPQISLSPNSFWWYQVHIDNHHCLGNLFKELGLCTFHHNYYVYGQSMSLPFWSFNTSWQQHLPFPIILQSSLQSFIAPNTCVFFFPLNNSSNNEWFTFKIPSKSVCTIIPFPTRSLTKYLKLLVFKFYHVLAFRQMFNLQLDQSSQPFDYLPHLSPQCFECGLDYHILQLHVSIDACAHIPLYLWVFTFYVAPMTMSA